MGQPEMMCARTKGGVIEHEQYCDSYYRCDRNGNPILEQCPNGLAFAGHRRGLASYCDYPHRVGCPDGTKVMGQAPIKSEGCEWSFGIFAHDTSCTRYWQCWNGTATLQQCPFSLLYNEQLKACDWADNVPDCQKHPICKESPNGSVAIEKSCTRYWLCVGGYPRIQRCPAGLAFNRETQKCDLDYTVPGCEPPPIVSNDLEGNNDNNNEKSSNGNGNSINSNNRDSILA
ncbi:hypothetical protein RDWZM_001120 [Blomia tropicalis]|uniref:Chitin-binding type-2 domain-containing protein n=1 Tax=Blomia tropicalis TaxID=40697 RepID=A0A9Q0MFG1_BLOTA|nr:hypothetical protein RDWZM_001120 [Blomia tropicalis]